MENLQKVSKLEKIHRVEEFDLEAYKKSLPLWMHQTLNRLDSVDFE